MEGIVRRALETNDACDIIMMHFVDPIKLVSYEQGNEPVVITNHNKVAAHYNVSVINLAKEVYARITNNEFTWNDDFKNLHPSPFGQGVYAHSIISFLNNAYDRPINRDDKLTSHNIPVKLNKGCYANGKLVEASTIKENNAWSIDHNWMPKDNLKVRDNYHKVPMLIGEEPEKALSYQFNGNAIGIAVAAGNDAGIIKYKIDHGNWTEFNLFSKFSSKIHLPRYYTLADDLKPGNHTIKIKLSSNKDPRSAGTACRIRYFYINELP